MGPSLRIVAINDVYTLENLPRLKSLVAHYRSHAPADAFLVTLAGDFVSPSLLSSLDNGAGMVDCINDLGVTHLVLGNHEDDIASEELHKRVGELRGVCLGTNVPGYDPSMPVSQVFEVGGKLGKRAVRVGLIGVVLNDPTIYRRVPFDGKATIAANVAALQETARLLQDEGCATVIPLTHQAVPDDEALARGQKNPPYPVILGGHEHTLFVEKVDSTWIVKAAAEGVHGVVVDIVWPEHAPADGTSDLPTTTVRVDDAANYPEDVALRAKVDAHLRILKDVENATLVSVAPGEALSSIGTRTTQTTLGTLLATCIKTTLGADAAFVNGGGIRGSRNYADRFTYADLRNEVPFNNEVVVVSLPGTLVQEAFAASRILGPAIGGGFFQADDRVEVAPGNVITKIDGQAFEPSRTYRIAMVRNLLLGLDKNEPLLRFARDNPGAVPKEDSGRDIKLVLAQAFARRIWDALGPFAKMDRNHDGKVTAEELQLAMQEVQGKAPSPVTTKLVLTALDQNQDGAITEEEATRR